jgi:hypothetical protein
MPDDVRSQLDQLALSQNGSKQVALEFQIGSAVLGDDSPESDDEPDAEIPGVDPDAHIVPLDAQGPALRDEPEPVPVPAAVPPPQIPEPAAAPVAPAAAPVAPVAVPAELQSPTVAFAPTAAPVADIMPVSAPPAQPPPPTHQYNLRKTNRMPWKQQSFHISAKKAIKQFGRKALLAALDELAQMPEKKVFVPQDVRRLSNNQLRKVIRSSMFFKEKYSPSGDFEKLKARLVAGGDQQDKSLYEDISSPTVSTSAVFIIAAIAAREQRKIVTVDITGAYLNADMGGEEVLMRLDKLMATLLVQIEPDYERFLLTDGSMIVKLTKALYGCIESAKLWYDNLSATLIADGFKRNKLDICVFNKDCDGKQCTVAVHVDDLMITCVEESACEHVVELLQRAYKDLTIHRGLVHNYLGMTFDFSTFGKVKITMEKYITDMMKTYGITGTAKTPASADLFDVPESLLLDAESAEEFHSRVAKILFLSKRVRPELLTANVFLASRVQEPTEADWTKLERLLKYINGTKSMGLALCADQDLSVIAYVDASYGVHYDAKSHTGSIISLGKGAIFAKSSKQKLVSKSSTEAELIGLSDSFTQAIWTRDFLVEQGYQVGPATIYQDNKSTIALAEKGRSTSDRTRHIHIRYYFVKDRIDSKEVRIEYMQTGLMLADLLTKPLQGELFRRLRNQLLNWDDEQDK